MAFKMNNTPEKLFHKAEGQVKQPDLNMEVDGVYAKNPEAAGKILPAALAVYGGYKAAQGAYRAGKKLVSKVKQGVADYKAGKAMRENTDLNKKEQPGTKAPDAPKKSTSSKMAGVGTDARKAQYDAKGWKYDDTIKGYNRDGSKKTAESKTTTKSTTTTPKAETTVTPKKTKVGQAIQAVKAKKAVADSGRKTSKAAKKQAQADAAAASGNTRKAARKQAAADRKTRKAKAKSDSIVDLSGSAPSKAMKGVGKANYKN